MTPRHVQVNKTYHLVLLSVVISAFLIDPAVSIRGGTTANKCDFPGLTVVVNEANAVLCTGVRVDLTVHFPLKCRFIIEGAVTLSALLFKNSGFQWRFPAQSSITGETTTTGTYTVNLPGGTALERDLTDPVGTSCFTGEPDASQLASLGFNGVLYDGTQALDTTTCQLAGYGADTNDGAVFYSANLQATPITQSTSAPCCNIIKDTLTTAEQGLGLVSIDNPFNCLYAIGSPCGLGDVGAPVMCKTTSDTTVTIGLVATAPCVDNGLFLVNDVTGSSPNTKFGVRAITR